MCMHHPSAVQLLKKEVSPMTKEIWQLTCSQNVAFADYASNNLTSIFIFNQNSSPLMSGGDLVSLDLITWHLDYPHYQSEIR